MADPLIEGFQLRRPLLVHVGDALNEDIKEALSDADTGATVKVKVLSADEFQERVEQTRVDAPLIEVIDQIVISVELDTSELTNRVRSVVEDILSVVSSEWIDTGDAQHPTLRLDCLIPPQAMPDGWTTRADVPTLFQLEIRVRPRQPTAAGPHVPVLKLSSQSLALVMKGGGIKGLAYVGALEVLLEHYKFRWFVGTSAGAIAAALLGAGYSVSELATILSTKDFTEFFDAPWYKALINIVFRHGLFPGDAVTEWMDRLLAEKLESATRVKLSELPNRVTLVASRREKASLTFDSRSNDKAVAYAVRCSMSIPLVFIPQSEEGIRTFDGGLQRNFPIDELLRLDPEADFVSLYLGPEVYEPVKQGFVLADLLSIWTESSEPDLLRKYKDQTVIIDTRPIGTLDFGLTETEKKFLVACGRLGALKHLGISGDQIEAARRMRDDLKQQVEDYRRQRRRRRIRRVGIATAIVVIATVLWWFCGAWIRDLLWGHRAAAVYKTYPRAALAKSKGPHPRILQSETT